MDSHTSVIGHLPPVDRPVTASKPGTYGDLKCSLNDSTYADVRALAPTYEASPLTPQIRAAH